MSRPELEVADIFRDHGAAWRRANAGHVRLEQMKVMSAIERCRTAALGGHVARCQDCPHTVIAYNSCRNRHCPKCQSAAAAEWLAAREADLLPVGYFHVVFTLPAAIANIAYQNKAVIYSSLLSKMCLFAKQSATYKSPRHRQCPTHRDFVPWRFSAAGHLSAWIDRHSGGRKPAHKRSIAPQQAA